MRRLLVMLLFTLLLIHPAAAQKRTDRESAGLKGPVRTVRLEWAEISQQDGKAVERPRKLQFTTTYDEKGNRKEVTNYNLNGSLQDKRIYTRDGEGNLTETIYKADGTMDSKLIYTYDEKGRITGWSVYDAVGSLRRKAIGAYDAHGKPTESAIYNADGSLMNKTVHSYDAEGKQAGHAVYNAAGVLMQTYERNGTEDIVVLYNEDGTFHYRSVSKSPTSEFDSHGNWIKQSTPRSITRAGKSEEVIAVFYRRITYY